MIRAKPWSGGRHDSDPENLTVTSNWQCRWQAGHSAESLREALPVLSVP